MKRPMPGFAGVVVAAATILLAIPGTAQTPPLTTLAEIHALSSTQANRGLPVAVKATVTYYMKGDTDLFLQDGANAVYAETSKTTKVSAGDSVLVVGHTQASFRPEIKADSVTVVGRGVMPAPVPATFKQLIHAEMDCRRVTLHAVVRGMDLASTGESDFIYFELLMDGGYIDAEVPKGARGDIGNLLDAEVEMTGSVAGKFDSKMQLAGILLEVPSTSDIKVLKRASAPPSSLPLTPMDQILAATDIQDRSQRVRVSGTVTYYQPGSALVLQDGDKSLWVNTRFAQPLRLGNRASASGFPDVGNGSIVLNLGEIEQSSVSAPIPARPVTSRELEEGSRALELVAIEGRLLISLRQAAQDEYVVVSGSHLFSAIYRHPERTLESSLPPMKKIPIGSRIRISGICVLDRGDQFLGPQAFSILLQSSDDVAIVSGPSPLNVRNLILLVGILLVALAVIGSRGWAIERRLRQKAAELVSIEQRRSEILEDINSSRSLADILGKIVQMVSFKLNGAPCWCVLADGTHVGAMPAGVAGLHVVDYPIASRPVEPLGSISIALDPSTKAGHFDEKIIPTAIELAFLAIETGRLHSALRHRSEFDLLTDVHNRFSLEERLDHLLESAKSGLFSFGLIYIDLDAFKQVNDTFGHDVGDLYLREAVSRMKSAIRPGDMLARIGGDEFAVLVERVTSVTSVQEVARRLRHCFDTPFEVAGKKIIGSASFGVSLCPSDGTTKDKVLKAADTAMYADKDAHRGVSRPRTSPNGQ